MQPFSFQDGLREGFRTRVICGVSQGDAPITLKWFKDNQPLQMASLPSTQVTVIDAFSSVLTIGALQPQHEGSYACQASNLADTVIVQSHLSVHVAPQWILEPENTAVIRGHSALINCLARGTPTPTIVWKKKIDTLGMSRQPPNTSGGDRGYRDIKVTQPQVTQLKNGSLLIARVELAHQGTYLCRAQNNVTHIDKTITLRVNSAPYFTSSGVAVDTKAGETAYLECRVRGDPSPELKWIHLGREVAHDFRAQESKTTDHNGDVISRLTVTDIASSDGGTYVCAAKNEHGKNAQIITLNVHEPPAPPVGLRLLKVSSRDAQIGWQTSKSRALSYLVQYKLLSQSWNESQKKSVKGSFDEGETAEAVEISPLIPSTDYVVRLIAINHLGQSLPSEQLRVKTGEEKPSAAPSGVQAEPLSATEIRVHWLAPPENQANGQILGYNVGIAQIDSYNHRGSTMDLQYNFTTVEADAVPGDKISPLQTVLKNLSPYTEYSLVVRAYNSEGEGPHSLPKNSMTLEDVPSGSVRDLRCTSLSKNSLQVYWQDPLKHKHNGVIRGYRLEYEDTTSSEDTLRHAQTTNKDTVLNTLVAATNYSIRVLAYTSAGDGPWSSPIMCITDEDVPGQPDGVRGVVSGEGRFIVSWAAPIKRGGIITQYTVKWRVVGSRLTSGRGRQDSRTVSGTVHWVEFSGVSGSLVEVDVVASTRVGRGPPGTARITLTNQIPAAIYSTGGDVFVNEDKDVILACLHVGKPSPRVVWKYQDQPIQSTTRKHTDEEGNLKIDKVQRNHSGRYNCSVSNKYGSDRTSFNLQILVKPEAPLVLASSSSTSSILVQWNMMDTGGAPVTGFILNYRKEDGLWTNVDVHRHSKTYLIKNLDCGTKYHIYLVAKNKVGQSNPSKTAIVQTLGGSPLAPEQDKFISVNKTQATIYTRTWKPQGCTINYFSVEYKSSIQSHWVQVSSGDIQSRVVHIKDLKPSTLYDLRATAMTSSGVTSQIYEFSTLNLAGEAPPIWHSMVRGQWLSVRVLLPLLTSAIALVSSLGLVCYCIKKKHLLSHGSRAAILQEDDEKREKARQTKYNMAQREQYYATIRKGGPLRGDSQSDIPENASDIYPYATFQLPDATNDIPMYSMYHERSNPKPEPYSKAVIGHRRRHSRSRSRSSRGRSMVGDSEDYETMNSDTETMLDDYEGGGVSSRTESSNQLEDMNAMREHSLIYTRTGASEVGLSQGNPRMKGGDHLEPKVPASKSVSRQSGSSGGDTIYGGGPIRTAQQLQQRIHHNLLYHAESSTSPETSPTTERKSFPRRINKSRTKTGGEPENSLSSAVSTDSISTKVNKPYHQTPVAIVHHKAPTQLSSVFKNPKNDKKTSKQQMGPQAIAGVIKKRRTNSSGSILSVKLPGKDGKIELSETECDREIVVPPPRSYSDAKYNQGCQPLTKNKKSKDFSIDV